MSTTVKFIILYLIPISTFAASFGIYLHSYGKNPEDTYVNIGFFFVICAFVVSSALAFNLIHQLLTNQGSYVSVAFALIPWIVSIIVAILYRVVFFGLFNP